MTKGERVMEFLKWVFGTLVVVGFFVGAGALAVWLYES